MRSRPNINRIIDEIKQFFSSITQIGVQSEMDFSLEKQVVFTNILVLLYAASIAVFTLFFFTSNLNFLGLTSLIWFIVTLIWIFFNKYGHYMMASFGLILITDLFGFIVCWNLGKESRFQVGYICAIGVPLILFGSKMKYVLTCGLIALVCYFTLEWMPPEAYRNYQVLSKTTLILIHAIIDLTVFIVTFLTIYYFYRLNMKNERKLMDTQKSLIQSGKMTALGEMAGGIAHEINTPLAAMLMNAERIISKSEDLLPSSDSEDISKRAKKIISIGNRIAKIISGLKIFSRNTQDEKKQYFIVKNLIEDTLDLCREKFTNQGIELRIKDDFLLTEIMGRPVQLSQVLLNLLNNSYDSVQYRNQKWIEIKAVIQPNFFDIIVTDCGLKIPPEIEEKIFNPFFTTKEIGKGTGLGLSISMGIMKSHDGDLIYDKTCKNARFIMRLPCNNLS
jgi:signal transduction histidine kinase